MCLAMFIARVRYGNENTKGFICKEYLLPEQHKAFLQGQGCPPQRQKCLLCSRYFLNYIYILVSRRATSLSMHTHWSCAYGCPSALCAGTNRPKFQSDLLSHAADIYQSGRHRPARSRRDRAHDCVGPYTLQHGVVQRGVQAARHALCRRGLCRPQCTTRNAPRRALFPTRSTILFDSLQVRGRPGWQKLHCTGRHRF